MIINDIVNSFKLHITLPKRKTNNPHKVNYNTESLPGEIWKDLVGYEGYYEISNLGRVKHLPFVSNNKRDTYCNKTFIVATKLSRGYRQLLLIDKYGNKQLKYLHRLVAITFIPNPNAYMFVNHKDEDKENNNVYNLEWCSAAYNNTYNNRHIKAGIKERKYIKLIKVEKDEEIIVDTIKLSDIKKYHISYQCLYKYIDTGKKFYSRVNQGFYRIEKL